MEPAVAEEGGKGVVLHRGVAATDEARDALPGLTGLPGGGGSVAVGSNRKVSQTGDRGKDPQSDSTVTRFEKTEAGERSGAGIYYPRGLRGGRG